jgi:Arc/MetJ-type ribon-helix-helix transcriptional regulator
MSTAVKLTPAQEAWLEAQVAAGYLPSVEDGVRSAVADLMALSTDDLEWAKPFIDQARASVARGDVTTGEVVLAELRSRISSFKSA